MAGPTSSGTSISVGNGYYQIRNEASGLVLDNSLSATEGTPIDQFQADYEPNQYWQVPLPRTRR